MKNHFRFWIVCGSLLWGCMCNTWAETEASTANISKPTPEWLVRDGKFLGEIVVAAGCDIDELSAAQELTDWIRKVCGTEEVNLRIERPSDSLATRGIFVGKTRAAANANIKPPQAGFESYAIVPQGAAVFIVGKTPAATHHAVAKFLTRTFGVEFVFPGADGVEWLPLRTVEFPKKSFSCVPAWTWRNIGVRGEENMLWARNLGFGVLPQFSHNLFRIFTPEVYEEYPELAPLCFGKISNRRRGGYAPQANLAHPQAETLALEAAREYFAEHPEAPMFSLGINDCSSWDESSDAEEIYGTEPMSWFRNRPNRSDYFWRFVDRVARKSAEETGFSDKKISAIAYLDCQDTPTFPLSKNVFPVLCADRANWVFPQFEADDKALMERWEKSGVEAWGIYDYYYGNPFFFPRIFFEAQAKSLKFAYDHGARLFYAEIFPQIPWDAPKIWLLAKLLENPKANPDDELENFYSLAYGKAATPMKQFFELFEKKWREQGGQCRWIKGWRNENSALIPGDVSGAAELLSKARNCFPEEPQDPRERRIVARIENAQCYWERSRAFEKSYRAREALEIASRNLKTPQQIKSVLASPAWHYEKIYDDAAWLQQHEGRGFAPCQMRISDPRPTAFVRVVDALRALPRSPERLEAEELLARVLAEMPQENTDRRLLRKLLLGLRSCPVFSEDFEPAYLRNPKDGELERKERFAAQDPNGWRKGKTLKAPKTLSLLLAPGEHLFCGESAEAYSGEGALKISGGGDSTELMRSIAVSPGTRIAASIYARGKTAIGGTNGLVLLWKDAGGRLIGEREFMRLPRECTESWQRFIVTGTAPENAVAAEVFIGGGLGDVDDFMLYDNLEVFAF